MSNYQPVGLYYIVECPICNSSHAFVHGVDFVMDDLVNVANWSEREFNCCECDESLIPSIGRGDGNYCYGAFCMYCGDMQYWEQEGNDPPKCPECGLVMLKASEESDVVGIAKDLFADVSRLFRRRNK